MFWIMLAIAVILASIFIYAAYKEIGPLEHSIILGYIFLALLIPFGSWSFVSLLACRVGTIEPTVTERIVATHVLEEIKAGEYIQTVFVEQDNGTCEEYIRYKVDGKVRQEKLQDVTIHFNEDEYRYEEHDKRFEDDKLNFLIINVLPTAKEIYLPGDKITGDYTLSEEDFEK